MAQGNTQTLRTTNTYAMAVTALMTAVTCILAPLSIPIGPVPISLTNFAIYLSLYLLDWKKGTISYILYLLLGLVGLPVFSGFTGGIGKLAGPTGGYIIGFIPMAIIAGIRNCMVLYSGRLHCICCPCSMCHSIYPGGPYQDGDRHDHRT